MVFRAVVFTFLPTAVELVLVCALLARTFTPIVSGLVVGTFALYVGWTASLTSAAAKVRACDGWPHARPAGASCESTDLMFDGMI